MKLSWTSIDITVKNPFRFYFYFAKILILSKYVKISGLQISKANSKPFARTLAITHCKFKSIWDLDGFEGLKEGFVSVFFRPFCITIYSFGKWISVHQRFNASSPTGKSIGSHSIDNWSSSTSILIDRFKEFFLH